MLLDGFEGCDQASGVIGPVEVPSIEPREVLKCSKELVSTDCHVQSVLKQPQVDRVGNTGCRNEAEVMGDCRVIDKGVGDHVGKSGYGIETRAIK